MAKILGKSEVCETNLKDKDVVGSSVASRTLTNLYNDIAKTDSFANTVGSTDGLPSWNISSIITL